jgi:hypothetical protein
MSSFGLYIIESLCMACIIITCTKRADPSVTTTHPLASIFTDYFFLSSSSSGAGSHVLFPLCATVLSCLVFFWVRRKIHTNTLSWVLLAFWSSTKNRMEWAGWLMMMDEVDGLRSGISVRWLV